MGVICGYSILRHFSDDQVSLHIGDINCKEKQITARYRFLLLTGVEDLENFHGKALGDKGVKAIEEIEKLLSSEKDVLKPKPAVEDAPKVVTPEPVVLSEAPSYAVGQKVKELTF